MQGKKESLSVLIYNKIFSINLVFMQEKKKMVYYL